MNATAHEQPDTVNTIVFGLLFVSVAALLTSGLLDGVAGNGAEFLARFEAEVEAWLVFGVR